MGWITQVLYAAVVLIWLFMAWRYLQARGSAPKSARNNLVILTLVVALLTVLQVTGLRQ